MEKILWALNKMPKSDDKCLPVMSLENIKQAREFHKSFPQYTVQRCKRADGILREALVELACLFDILNAHNRQALVFAFWHLV